jgi:hypothetical protein
MKENTTRTDEQIRQLAERRKLLFKDVVSDFDTSIR